METDWIVYSLEMWLLTAYFGVVGAVSYVNKFYRFNGTILMHMAIGFLLPILWCAFMLSGYFYDGALAKTEKFLYISLTGFYIAGYFFCLALCLLTDTSFTCSTVMLVNFFCHQ
eukprot:TRINITY_DN15258_c0_g1_i1.p2 TRINITY_DN15258_c0_g1~~TRINITY_DN15258_c0_g1_i1.p2  ORF type:complete len:114 (+),score=8.02 TRINITY_DN15258_c0_g1_i1:443-784(+)